MDSGRLCKYVSPVSDQKMLKGTPSPPDSDARLNFGYLARPPLAFAPSPLTYMYMVQQTRLGVNADASGMILITHSTIAVRSKLQEKYLWKNKLLGILY